MTPLSLIVCASPRSGSYYLLDLLSKYGLPFGDEWLTPFHQGSRKAQYGQDDSLPYLDYLRLLSERERYNGVFVMKVMYPQFAEMQRALEDLEGPPEMPLIERISSIFPNPRFLYLTRQDTLAQAVSHLKARQTRRWVKRSAVREPQGVDPVYSYLGILQHMLERERNHERWCEFLKSDGVDSLQFVFESLREDPQGSMETFFSWLGQETPEVQEAADQPRFKQMANSLNQTWKQRFLEEHASCPDTAASENPEILENLRIIGTDLTETCEISSGCRFRVKVEYTGPALSEYRGLKDGTGWLRVAGRLEGPGIKECFQNELRPAGDGLFMADCVLPVPKTPGNGQLKLVLTDRFLWHGSTEFESAEEFPVKFVHGGARMESRKFFQGIRDMPNGWQSLPWFGCFLDDKFPWIYHADHEWLYIKPQIEEGNVYHVLDLNLGWIEINPATYPTIRSLESGEKYVFEEREKDLRKFRNSADGREFTVQTNTTEHLKKLPKKS